jgi:2-phosphosulfolactate phosphatase
VIAAGERWSDHALRPSVEDLLGAGAVLDGLSTVEGGLSVEAAVALAALASIPHVAAAVGGSVSGLELTTGGFAEDVAIATRIGASDVVPVLRSDAFAPA